VTTAGDAYANVNVGYQFVSNEISTTESFVAFFRTEFVEAKDQERFVNFEAQDFRLDE